jgi:hypothetical protein
LLPHAVYGIKPKVGFNPTMPQLAAGTRIDPPYESVRICKRL